MIADQTSIERVFIVNRGPLAELSHKFPRRLLWNRPVGAWSSSVVIEYFAGEKAHAMISRYTRSLDCLVYEAFRVLSNLQDEISTALSYSHDEMGSAITPRTRDVLHDVRTAYNALHQLSMEYRAIEDCHPVYWLYRQNVIAWIERIKVVCRTVSALVVSGARTAHSGRLATSLSSRETRPAVKIKISVHVKQLNSILKEIDLKAPAAIDSEKTVGRLMQLVERMREIGEKTGFFAVHGSIIASFVNWHETAEYLCL